jgi:hypothetical protein
MADDSGVGVGGDGSVMWKVWANNVRRGSVVSKWTGDYSYVDSGVDETPEGKNFTIGIKVPRANGEDFARALAEAAKDAEAHAKDPGYRVKFPLVIEPKNEDQIVITWESTPAPESKPGLLASLKKKLTRKTGKAMPKKKNKPIAKGRNAKKAGKKKRR